MPTNNAKARILLRKQKATVVTVKPFTIMLTYHAKTQYVQPIILGIDSGYLNVGFSAVTKKKELIGGAISLIQRLIIRKENFFTSGKPTNPNLKVLKMLHL